MSHSPDHEHEESGGSVVIEPAPPELTKPPLYAVLLLNDDYTPMEKSHPDHAPCPYPRACGVRGVQP